jgi:hypothetical protein
MEIGHRVKRILSGDVSFLFQRLEAKLLAVVLNSFFKSASLLLMALLKPNRSFILLF